MRQHKKNNPVAMEACEPRQMMASTIYNIAGTGGNDKISVNYTHTTSGDILFVNVNGNKQEFFKPSIAALNISGLGGNDNITFRDYRDNAAGWATNIYGNEGNDTITLGSEGLYDPIELRYIALGVTGGAGSDTLVMDSSMASSWGTQTLTVRSDEVNLGPSGATPKYWQIENLNLKTRDTATNVYVKSVLAGTNVNITANTLGSNITIGDGDLDNIKGTINIDGVSGNDPVTLNDGTDTNGRAYTFTNTGVWFNTGGAVNWSNVDAIGVTGSKGNSTYRVHGVLAGMPLTIGGGSGYDRLEIGNGNYQANIKAPVYFWDDTAGTGSVVISDHLDTGADTYNVSGGQFNKPGSPATMWAYANAVSLFTNNDANVVNVTPSRTVSFLLDANSQAAGTMDRLVVNADAGETVVRQGTGNGLYLFADKKPISFYDFEDTPASMNLPTLTIGDAVVMEGNSGTTLATFTVTLSKPMFVPVTFNYATGSNTAAADADYASMSGQLTFAAGETTKTVQVQVFGDVAIESDESFFLNLSGAQNATIAKAIGIGAIINDDLASVISTEQNARLKV